MSDGLVLANILQRSDDNKRIRILPPEHCHNSSLMSPYFRDDMDYNVNLLMAQNWNAAKAWSLKQQLDQTHTKLVYFNGKGARISGLFCASFIWASFNATNFESITNGASVVSRKEAFFVIHLQQCQYLNLYLLSARNIHINICIWIHTRSGCSLNWWNSTTMLLETLENTESSKFQHCEHSLWILTLIVPQAQLYHSSP